LFVLPVCFIDLMKATIAAVAARILRRSGQFLLGQQIRWTSPFQSVI